MTCSATIRQAAAYVVNTGHSEASMATITQPEKLLELTDGVP
jgi:hypothetical protein